MKGPQVYTVQRTAILDTLRDDSGRQVATIERTKKIWIAEGAPLTPAVRAAGLDSGPVITVGETRYPVHRRLTSNRFLTNDYDIWLADKDGPVIETQALVRQAGYPIRYRGRTYQLVRKSFLSFDFRVLAGGQERMRFADTTPFWTFSASRAFAIHTSEKPDPLLLTFAFFLAVSRHFG